MLAKVYRALDILTMVYVAVKLESTATCPLEQSYLDHEAHQYDEIGEGPGIPKKIWYGTEGGFRVLVLELLGDNLTTISGGEVRFCLCPKLVATLAVQMVRL